MRKLQVKLLNDKARLPVKGTKQSAGWDLYLPKDFSELEIPAWSTGLDSPTDHIITLYPHSSVIIPLGISLRFPEGTYGHIEPRSSCYFKRDLLVMGEVDEDYTGEIRLKFTNLSKINQKIYSGERLAQMILLDYQADVEVQEVDDISRDSERGENAYGSTGR